MGFTKTMNKYERIFWTICYYVIFAMAALNFFAIPIAFMVDDNKYSVLYFGLFSLFFIVISVTIKVVLKETKQR